MLDTRPSDPPVRREEVFTEFHSFLLKNIFRIAISKFPTVKLPYIQWLRSPACSWFRGPWIWRRWKPFRTERRLLKGRLDPHFPPRAPHRSVIGQAESSLPTVELCPLCLSWNWNVCFYDLNFHPATSLHQSGRLGKKERSIMNPYVIRKTSLCSVVSGQDTLNSDCFSKPWYCFYSNTCFE